MPNDLTPLPPTGRPLSSSQSGPAQALACNLFDPAGLGPLPSVPLIPEATRRKRHVFVETDTRFRQAARFLADLWRRDRKLPIGTYTDGNGQTRKLGSRLTPKAGEQGTNFMDSELLPVVNRALIYRELGAVYELDRLKTNLIASQTLVFNAFGPLARDPALATRFMAELLPGVMDQVTHVLFETSPGRGDPRFTADGTAFDLALIGRASSGQRVYCAAEIKYTESGHEPVPRFTGRFDQIAPTCGLFVDPYDPKLRTNPVQQSFRQLCLAATVLDQGLADQALLLFVAPQHNHLAQASAHAVRRHLVDPDHGRVPFVPITLEQVFAALAVAGLPGHARALHRRYTDFWLVDGELQLDPPPTTPAGARTTPASSTVVTPPPAPTQPRRKRAPRSRPSPRPKRAA